MNWLLDFVKDAEGFVPSAYLDPVGVITLGYGFTRIHGRSLLISDTITEVEAIGVLKEELEDFADCVIKFDDKHDYEWNENQIAALTSFSYNLGKGSISQVTNGGERTNELIAEKMLLYVNAGGEPLPGLITRRIAESNQFKKAP